jgi:hypothetical protein
MTVMNESGARTVMIAFAAYLFVCSISAIFFPVSWLWTAGLNTLISPELGLVFSVLGSYLLSLSIGAWIASRSPAKHRGIIAVLLASQICDFFATLLAVYSGSLPRLPGTGFLVLTVIWSTVLGLAWYTCATPENTQTP